MRKKELSMGWDKYDWKMECDKYIRQISKMLE